MVFGPHPRSYAYRPPKKVRKAALRSALSLKLKEQNLLILDDLKLEEIKTKEFARIMGNLDVDSALFIIPGRDEVIEKSARNLRAVKILRSEGINVYDILKFKQLVLTKDTVAKIETGLKQ